jgi:hypothetical protein
MITASPKSLSKAQTVGWAALIVIAGTILYLINPPQQLGWLRCPVNLLTGLYCPGCGSLRAIHALLHGNLLLAMSCNLLTVIALPALLLYGIREIACNMLGRSTSILISPVVAWSIFWIVIGFTLVRNLPFEVFHFLRP